MRPGPLEVYQTWPVSEGSNGETGKAMRVQTRDERNKQITMVIIRIRIGYLIFEANSKADRDKKAKWQSGKG